MTYYLSLGANLGNREATLNSAIELLQQQTGSVLQRSSFFYSQAWGFDSPHEFCNVCVSVSSPLPPYEMLAATQHIERLLGRTAKSVDRRYHDRLIDIDLLLAFDDEQQPVTINAETLTIPHPLMYEREFVIVPLRQILPSAAL